MRRCGPALLGAVLLLLPASRAAADPQKWYLGIGANWSGFDPIKFHLGLPAGPASGKLALDDSAAIDLNFGYRFPLPVRLEAEVLYADFDASHFRLDGLSAVPLGGDASTSSLLINATYDLSLSDQFAFTLGAGMGATRLDSRIDDAMGDRIRGSQTSFTWQAIAGLTATLSDRWEIEADYRYQNIEGSGGSFVNAFVSPISLKDKTIQSAMLNLRWYLSGRPRLAEATPASAPPPPPPPAPVRTFIVFFDFDKADLTQSAAGVVAVAVKSARETGAVKVLVTGHTDMVGSASYNLALSQRRAEAVKAQMVADGIADNAIATMGRGFGDLLVATGPGTREPRNRRAVIDLGADS